MGFPVKEYGGCMGMAMAHLPLTACAACCQQLILSDLPVALCPHCRLQMRVLQKPTSHVQTVV